jgi:hypothetical protein
MAMTAALRPAIQTLFFMKDLLRAGCLVRP